MNFSPEQAYGLLSSLMSRCALKPLAQCECDGTELPDIVNMSQVFGVYTLAENAEYGIIQASKIAGDNLTKYLALLWVYLLDATELTHNEEVFTMWFQGNYPHLANANWEYEWTSLEALARPPTPIPDMPALLLE